MVGMRRAVGTRKTIEMRRTVGMIEKIGMRGVIVMRESGRRRMAEKLIFPLILVLLCICVLTGCGDKSVSDFTQPDSSSDEQQGTDSGMGNDYADDDSEQKGFEKTGKEENGIGEAGVGEAGIGEVGLGEVGSGEVRELTQEELQQFTFFLTKKGTMDF